MIRKHQLGFQPANTVPVTWSVMRDLEFRWWSMQRKGDILRRESTEMGKVCRIG